MPIKRNRDFVICAVCNRQIEIGEMVLTHPLNASVEHLFHHPHLYRMEWTRPSKQPLDQLGDYKIVNGYPQPNPGTKWCEDLEITQFPITPYVVKRQRNILSKKYHPSRLGENGDMQKKINNAYDDAENFYLKFHIALNALQPEVVANPPEAEGQDSEEEG